MSHTNTTNHLAAYVPAPSSEEAARTLFKMFNNAPTPQKAKDVGNEVQLGEVADGHTTKVVTALITPYMQNTAIAVAPKERRLDSGWKQLPVQYYMSNDMAEKMSPRDKSLLAPLFRDAALNASKAQESYVSMRLASFATTLEAQ